MSADEAPPVVRFNPEGTGWLIEPPLAVEMHECALPTWPQRTKGEYVPANLTDALWCCPECGRYWRGVGAGWSKITKGHARRMLRRAGR